MWCIAMHACNNVFLFIKFGGPQKRTGRSASGLHELFLEIDMQHGAAGQEEKNVMTQGISLNGLAMCKHFEIDMKITVKVIRDMSLVELKKCFLKSACDRGILVKCPRSGHITDHCGLCSCRDAILEVCPG